MKSAAKKLRYSFIRLRSDHKFGVTNLISFMHTILRLLVNASIDNIHHLGYETNKRHLNQGSFGAPIYIGEKILSLCFKMLFSNKLFSYKLFSNNSNKGCYNGSIMSTHYSKQRINLENSAALEGRTGIELIHCLNSLYGEKAQH